MSAWYRGPLAPYDVESTGIDVFTDRIVTAALGKVGADHGPLLRSWRINPGVPIPPGATAIHRITDEMAAGYAPAPTAVDSLAVALVDLQLDGVPLVGWNVAYDLTILDSELVRYELPTLERRLGRPVGPCVDGLVLDKKIEPFRKGSRKLVDVARHYGVRLDDIDAHGAEADALAAARVIWKMANRHPEIGGMRLHALHEQQVEWAQAQADSLRAHFEKTGKEHDGVDGTWPLRQRAAVPA